MAHAARRALLAVLCGLAVAGAASGAADEFLILQLRLHSHVLADALPALADQARVYLPLGEFCAALEFPVRVDPAAGTAAGWFRDEGRTLALDLTAGRVTVAGEARPVAPGAFRVEPDDVYVAAGLLEEWFGVTLAVDRSELQVRVSSERPLPLERRLERERARARALASRQSLERPGFPLTPSPRRWLSWPFADVSLRGTRRRDAGGAGAWEYDHSVLASADLLRMTGEVFAAGDQGDGLSELRLRLGRRDPRGRVLGSLGVTEFVAGDVFTPPDALVARSVRGRGVRASTLPLDRPDEFDRTVLRGPAPPGWEAELYRGASLLEFQVVGADGRYEFTDVPVLFGRNPFEVVLYGPQGQERRVPYPLYVGPGSIEPGVGRWSLAVAQHETDLVAADGAAADPGPGAGQPRWVASWERGVGGTLSLAASLSSLPLESGGGWQRHHYLGLGARGSRGAVFATLDGVWDATGGGAVQGALQGRWRDLNWFAEHGRFWGFASERVEAADPLEERTRVRGEWGGNLLLPVSVALEASREVRRSGDTHHAVAGRVSAAAGFLLATHRLRWQRFAGAGVAGDGEQAQGSLLLSTAGGPVTLRGELNYAAVPAGELQDTAVSVDWGAGAWGGVRARWGYAFAPERTTYSLGWNRTFPVAAVGLDGEYRDDGTYAVGLSATFGVGRDPAAGRWSVRAEPLAARASAAVRVVRDRNGDGRVDPGDEPLAGVRLEVNGRAVPGVATDAGGEAFLAGLPAYRLVDVTVEEASLEDPYWVVAPRGQRVLVRPGATPVLEFLVVDTGEIEGTVFLLTDEEVRQMPGVKVQLVDPQGRVVQETTSAFDGFYLLQKVPLGRYSVRVEPELVRRGRLLAGEPRPVILEPGAEVATGVEFVLEDAAGDPP